MHGEPLDLVPYYADPARYVTNALAPGDLQRIVVDPSTKRMEIIVANGAMLATASGAHGENVRLAAALTGWRLELFTKAHYAELETIAKHGVAVLLAKLGAKTVSVDALFKLGWRSVADLAKAKPDELAKDLLPPDLALARKIIAAAQRAKPAP